MAVVAVVSLFACAVNLPGGYFRAGTRRFSWQWFLAVHLPVLPVAWLRAAVGASAGYIPLFLLASVLGQWAGGSLHERLDRRDR